MKIVLQDGVKDCGVCSLLSIIRYYGGDVSKEYLRELTNTTRNGVNAYNLIEGARKLGFASEGVEGDMQQIENNNLPCLAHVIVKKNFKHFVVIYKIDTKSEKVVIMDPAKGKRTLSFSEFKLMSTNNFIYLKPTKQLPQIMKKKVILKVIKNYFKNNKKMFLILSILVLSYFILNIIVAFHFKYLLNYAINYKVSTNIVILSGIVFIIYLLRGICNVLKNILFVKVSSVVDEVLTLKTFRQILLLPYLYYKNRTTGEVITRLRDLNTVKSYLIQVFNILVTDILGMIIFLILMININIEITGIVLLVIVVLVLFIMWRNRRKRRMITGIRKKEEKVNSYLIEALNNVDTIKGGHIEKRLGDKFLYLYKDLLEKSYLYSLFIEVNYFVRENLKDILYILVYGIGGYLVVKGRLGIGDIILYQSFLMYFLGSVEKVINLIDEYDNYKVSLSRVEDLYTLSQDKFFGSYYYYNYSLDGDILFNNLSYKYSRKLILDNVSLVIKKGEKILLTGESGSGKSSLVKILMRYLEVSYGMCSISGIDINHYHLENIRKNISYVSSSDFLFTDSLYNNITLEREVLEEEFLEVCRITKVDEIIKVRDSDYQLLVEENGFNFSNGERQRIILARYLLRKSNIYIFDESFGQIDISKEKEILEEMFKYLEKKTVVVVSHRFNNMKLFDKVLRLERGKIFEEKI